MSEISSNEWDGAGESELHAAAWSGDLKWVKSTIAKGADIHWKDSDGETALFGACGWGRTSVVKFLISLGAKVNIKEEIGLTPLHWAAQNGGLETIKILIESGANPFSENCNGDLPIDLAHSAGKGNRVAYLKTVGPAIKSKRSK